MCHFFSKEKETFILVARTLFSLHQDAKIHQKQKHCPKLQQKEPFDGPSIEAVDFISDGTISSRDP
jgi:hypothetical protein